MNEEDLKWQKLLWALVITLGMYLLFCILFVTSHEIFGVYPYLVFGWWIVVPLAVLALGLRLLKVFKNKNFLYILIGIINLFMGMLNIYFMRDWPDIEIRLLLAALLPLAFSTFIIIDFLRRRGKANKV